jgi:hypothetical protein
VWAFDDDAGSASFLAQIIKRSTKEINVTFARRNRQLF